MHQITFGKTGLVLEKNGFGCLPIQRISEQDAVYLLHKAYDGGINFYDTARAYSDSEQKVGAGVLRACEIRSFLRQRRPHRHQAKCGRIWRQAFAR